MNKTLTTQILDGATPEGLRDLGLIEPSSYTSARTEYQIRHFVIGQHATPQRQWSQLMAELRAGLLELANRKLELERARLARDSVDNPGWLVRMSATVSERKRRRWEIAQHQARLNFKSAAVAFRDKRVDVERLIKVAQEMTPYTEQDIEAGEAAYWSERLKEQAGDDINARIHGVSPGNLRAIRNAGVAVPRLSEIEREKING